MEEVKDPLELGTGNAACGSNCTVGSNPSLSASLLSSKAYVNWFTKCRTRGLVPVRQKVYKLIKLRRETRRLLRLRWVGKALIKYRRRSPSHAVSRAIFRTFLNSSSFPR